MSNFVFKKKFGQNFLENESICDQIVNSIDATSNDLIIEIGPGAGAITSKLKKYDANLIAFEIDRDVKPYLDSLEDDKTKIYYEDFMESNVKNIIESMQYEKLYIVGNLPYYITTPILERIIDQNLDETSITIMVQKEVGERFSAHPHTKSYGYMTVLLSYWYDIEIITEVKREYFKPVPNVDSMVLKLTKKEATECDYQKFKEILKNSFQFKRKTIGNNLKSYDREKLTSILSKHNYGISDRAEDIDLETFIDLSKNL